MSVAVYEIVRIRYRQNLRYLISHHRVVEDIHCTTSEKMYYSIPRLALSIIRLLGQNKGSFRKDSKPMFSICTPSDEWPSPLILSSQLSISEGNSFLDLTKMVEWCSEWKCHCDANLVRENCVISTSLCLYCVCMDLEFCHRDCGLTTHLNTTG